MPTHPPSPERRDTVARERAAISFPNPYLRPGRAVMVAGGLIVAAGAAVAVFFLVIGAIRDVTSLLNLVVAVISASVSIMSIGVGILARGTYVAAQQKKLQDRQYIVRWTYPQDTWPKWAVSQI